MLSHPLLCHRNRGIIRAADMRDVGSTSLAATILVVFLARVGSGLVGENYGLDHDHACGDHSIRTFISPFSWHADRKLPAHMRT